jgi:hypothetical protein
MSVLLAVGIWLADLEWSVHFYREALGVGDLDSMLDGTRRRSAS